MHKPPRRIGRRAVVASIAGLAASSAINLSPALAVTSRGPTPFAPYGGPRSRVLFVNDLSGDIDGLYAAVHQILSPTAQLQGIIGTGTGRPNETAARSAALANEMLDLMGKRGKVAVFEGASSKLRAGNSPIESPGTKAIIAEAMRSDTELPLFVAVGGGLTEVASAIMIEPRIADRMTLVWIGGDALPGGTGETNFNIDPLAARFIFNETSVPLWQLPRAVYQTCVVSASEIETFVAPHGRIGKWLYERLGDVHRKYRGRINSGETWTLGDSPLVALTALHDWIPSSTGRVFRYERTGSSLYDEIEAPLLNPDGTFAPRSGSRKIRVYRTIDTRLLFNDFFAKVRRNYPTT